jgi:hypothetical protein
MRRPGTVEETGSWMGMRHPGTVELDLGWECGAMVQLKKQKEDRLRRQQRRRLMARQKRLMAGNCFAKSRGRMFGSTHCSKI